MKYAIVTGGTRGIGKQLCISLLCEGYFVITNYAKDDFSAGIARVNFLSHSSNFKIIKCDQSKDSDIDFFVKSINKITKEIHCIICNTGTTLRKSFDSITNNEWESIFKINVHSHYYLIRDLNSKIQNNGRIIFIGSILGDIPHATSLIYGITKAALHALAKNLVKEFSEREVTVNVVAPGFVETDWQNDKPLSIRKSIYNKTAIKRFADVDEISMVCMMLLKNDFINGAIINVDGGYNYR